MTEGLRRPSPALRAAGILVVVWALLPPFTPPELETSLTAEIVDHVIPAVLIAVLLGVAWRGLSGYAMFNLGLVVGLAALFMLGTHIPLIAQAARGDVGWGPAIHHSAASLAVLAFAGWWVWSFRR